eukprot:PhF_6_TR12987/c0_g1_i1/m.20537
MNAIEFKYALPILAIVLFVFICIPSSSNYKFGSSGRTHTLSHQLVTTWVPWYTPTTTVPENIIGGLLTNDIPYMKGETLKNIDIFLSHGLTRLVETAQEYAGQVGVSSTSSSYIANAHRVADAYGRFRDTLQHHFNLAPDHVSTSVFLKETYLWVQVHPTLGCRKIERTGFQEDGSKYVCNPASLVQTAYHNRLRVVGLGSNNDFTWEEDTLRYFRPEHLERFDVYDCTVDEKLKPLPQKVHFHKICVGKETTKKIMRLKPRPFVAFYETFSIPIVRRPTQIDILKCDVESSEYDIAENWLKGRLNADQTGQHVAIHQIQMEVHRRYHPNGGAFLAVNKHIVNGMIGLFLHMYALGFVPVYWEPNTYQACCYEYIFVNTTWFLASEEIELADLATIGSK